MASASSEAGSSVLPSCSDSLQNSVLAHELGFEVEVTRLGVMKEKWHLSKNKHRASRSRGRIFVEQGKVKVKPGKNRDIRCIFGQLFVYFKKRLEFDPFFEETQLAN